MLDVIRLLPGSGWERLVIDAAWQSTLLAGIALSIIRWARLRPATRAAMALAAAILCVATPVVSGMARQQGWGLVERPAAQAETIGRVKAARDTLTVSFDGPSNNAGVSTQSTYAPNGQDLSGAEPASHFSQWLAPAFAFAWLITSLSLALRLLRSAWAVHAIGRAAIPCDDDALHVELLRAAQSLDVRPPALCVSSALDSPALVTWGSPRLLLPAKSLARCDWFAVFCHELAHLARRDGGSRLVVEVVTVLLPWQPLVWLLRREFRASCEEACDDWAVAAGADPVEFAALLVDFIPQARPVFVLGMSESVSAARNRVLRLLASQGTPRPRLGRFLAVSGWVLAVGLGVALALLQYGTRPRDLPPWGDKAVAVAALDVIEAAQRPLQTPYRVEPPDVLLIDAVKVVPKPPYRIEPLDTLHIEVLGTLPDQPIAGPYSVESDGTIALGATYGTVSVSGKTLAEAKGAIVTQLESILTAPEVSISLVEAVGVQQIKGEHLIGPDGTVNLGSYGSVWVAGMTLSEARAAVEKHLTEFLDQPKVSVDVYAYNSKVYYVIYQQDGSDMVQRFPITGSETLLDALAQLHPNLKFSSSALVWVSRPVPGGGKDAKPTVLPVDWRAIFRGESNATNYWLQPGDRVFVSEPR